MNFVRKYKKVIFGLVLGIGCIFGVVEYDQMLLLLGNKSETYSEKITQDNLYKNHYKDYIYKV